MLYLQTCITGLAILLIPLLNLRRGYGRDRDLFRAVVIVVMLDLVSETTGWLLDGKTFPGAVPCIYAVNVFTILLQSVMGLLWLYYALEKLDIRLPKGSPLHLLCAVPLLFNVALLVTNYWSHFLFVVTPDNLYQRGSLIGLTVAASFLYPLAATVLSLAASAKAESSAKKQSSLVLASFVLPPITAAALQLIFYGTFLFLIGFAISLLVVFVNIQNEQITIDFLTRINNRASFISYYEHKARNVRPDCALYLFMIDVDSFKYINDTYGHVVGDQVLITVAEQLKRICAGQRCFLARLGGDEFSILLESEHAREARIFAGKIHSALDEFNSDSNLSRPVTLSVGYASSTDPERTVDSLILQADEMMYAEKAVRHLSDSPEA